MSVTFFIALVVALLAIVYWRIVLVIVAAILIAMAPAPSGRTPYAQFSL